MNKRVCLTLMASLTLTLFTSPLILAKSGNPDQGAWTQADQEYYLSATQISFLRPGVDFELISIEIPADLQPVVHYKLMDTNGAPLDKEGILTPGPIRMYFMLDYVPQGEEEVVPYCQTSRFCYDRGGEDTTLALGEYEYKFATVLPDDYDRDATHTLSSVARRQFDPRNDPAFEFLGLNADYNDNDVYNFIPSGVGEPKTRDIVRTETCNRCHNPLGMHGGDRFEQVRICLHCHNEVNVGGEGNPDDPSYALGPLVHRVHSNNEPELIEDGHHVTYPAPLNNCEVCHTGGTPTANAPLVANPNPTSSCNGNGLGMTEVFWGDYGNIDVRIGAADGSLFASAGGAKSQATGNWVSDGMEFYLVDQASGETIGMDTAYLTTDGCVNNPPYAFYGEAGEMNDNWMYRPSRHACGGCHFDINFATGEGHLPQDSDDNCSTCHQPFGKEFDASVAGAHTVSRRSIELSGVLVEILGVEFTEPGNKPRVTFSLKSKTGMMDPSALNRLRFTLVGPNEDFDFYVQEDALDNLTANGSNWEYRFRKPLPKEAMGSFSIAVEGRTNTQVLANEGTDDEISLRQVIESLTVPIAVTDTAPVGRREIVEDALCEACHSNLLLHGSNRTNGTDGCQVCHSPAATDEEERPPGSKPESIHFKYLIHKIHRGADLENEFIVYGHNGSVHDEFMEVHFPGDLRDCESCHVPGSYTLPLPDGVLPTETSNTLLDFMMPITSACLSCHDSDSAAIHADSNSTDLGESCETCHGEGKTYGVRRVHAR